jgi:hypothetical protein
LARRSKRTRNADHAQGTTPGGSAQAAPPPFPFPEGPRGFRLRWLNAKEEGDPDAYFLVARDGDAQKIGQFTRNLPDDLMERTRWLDRHMIRHQSDVPEDWCATLWHGLHHGWMYHRQQGIQGFMTEQIEMMGGVEEVHKLGGMWISVTLLPEGRPKQRFPVPHIVLCVEPDGEFCRVLATEYWGPCAIGIAAERDFPTILGPVSVGLMGAVLVDGVPYPKGSGGEEPTLMLMDPLTVLADLGPVTGMNSDGVLEYQRWGTGTAGRLYHPDDTLSREYMHDAQRGFLDLWDGRVPGFVGKIGTLHHKIKENEAREARERAKMPVNPQYMEALERQLETARFMHDRKPFRTVRGLMQLQPTPYDYDHIVGEALESAVTHYWTPMMCGLLTRNYPTLPEFWLRAHELGPRRGYMWFAEPIPLVPGDPEHVRAMAWGTDEEDGYFVCPFTCFRGPGAELIKGTFDVYHGAPRHLIAWREGESLTAWIERERQMFLNPEYARNTRTLSGLDTDTDYQQRIAWGRVFATAVTIMNQTLVTVAPYGADRNSRRRIERLRPPGVEPPHPLVKAILLRRQYTVRQGPAPDSEPVDWSCQWVVHEHWRQQWYPSLNQHKWVMIAEHLKGPPDKPLKDPLPIRLVGR